jgi:hypothetical protein
LIFNVVMKRENTTLPGRTDICGEFFRCSRSPMGYYHRAVKINVSLLEGSAFGPPHYSLTSECRRAVSKLVVVSPDECIGNSIGQKNGDMEEAQ